MQAAGNVLVPPGMFHTSHTHIHALFWTWQTANFIDSTVVVTLSAASFLFMRFMLAHLLHMQVGR